MSATATLPAMTSARSVPAPRPVVFLSGRPEPDFVLEQLSAEGPLDLRGARFRTTAHNPQHFANAQVIAATPRLLIDEQVAWEVLVHGRLAQTTNRTSEGNSYPYFTTEDSWAEVLRSPAQNLWQADPLLGLQTTSQARLNLGDQSNRSNEKYLINGKQIHVPQSSGEHWTVGQTLDTLSAFY